MIYPILLKPIFYYFKYIDKRRKDVFSFVFEDFATIFNSGVAVVGNIATAISRQTVGVGEVLRKLAEGNPPMIWKDPQNNNSSFYLKK